MTRRASHLCLLWCSLVVLAGTTGPWICSFVQGEQWVCERCQLDLTTGALHEQVWELTLAHGDLALTRESTVMARGSYTCLSSGWGAHRLDAATPLIQPGRPTDRINVSFGSFHFCCGSMPGTTMSTVYHGGVVPLWSILLPSAVPPILWLARRKRAPAPMSACTACGYDLRATPDRCPECGAVPAR
jgi:hypothetical protein